MSWFLRVHVLGVLLMSFLKKKKDLEITGDFLRFRLSVFLLILVRSRHLDLMFLLRMSRTVVSADISHSGTPAATPVVGYPEPGNLCRCSRRQSAGARDCCVSDLAKASGRQNFFCCL